jgi:hypothetical protein
VCGWRACGYGRHAVEEEEAAAAAAVEGGAQAQMLEEKGTTRIMRQVGLSIFQSSFLEV